MDERLPVLLSAIASDILTGYMAGGAATIGAVSGLALADLMKRRAETARDILLSEMRRGDKSIVEVQDVEPLVAILYRFSRAAQEGTARLNLRLMAKVIAGQAHIGNFRADEFLYYAGLLASLRREEIILIATLQRLREDPEILALDEGERAGSAQKKAIEGLVPAVFKSAGEFKAVANATLRTGLVVAGTGWGGGMIHQTSPLMDRLEQLAPFEDALKREGHNVA